MDCTRVQEFFSNAYQGMKEGAVAAGEWLGKTVTWMWGQISDFASKAAQFAKPHWESFVSFASKHLENAKNFVIEHKEYFIIGGVAAAVGAVGYALANAFCCKYGLGTSPSQPGNSNNNNNPGPSRSSNTNSNPPPRGTPNSNNEPSRSTGVNRTVAAI